MREDYNEYLKLKQQRDNETRNKGAHMVNEEYLTRHLSTTQKEILNTIRNMKDISELDKYNWSYLYPTLQTLKALCLITYEGEINYPAQLTKLIQHKIDINKINSALNNTEEFVDLNDHRIKCPFCGSHKLNLNDATLFTGNNEIIDYTPQTYEELVHMDKLDLEFQCTHCERCFTVAYNIIFDKYED